MRFSKIILIIFNYVKILNNRRPPFYILTNLCKRSQVWFLKKSPPSYLLETFSVTFVALFLLRLACLPLSQLIFIHARLLLGNIAPLAGKKEEEEKFIT